jgi:metal-dependent amidase/aminoacylase/carboxypeptidase family protein
VTIAPARRGKLQDPRAQGSVLATVVAVAAFAACHAVPSEVEEPAVAALSPLFGNVERTLVRQRDAIVELRRDLHTHPELSGEEQRTAGLVAERMRALGLDIRGGVGGHGVIARLSGAYPGRTIGFRADMDAFASSAPDPYPFPSTTPGVRHICGHDVHTAVAIATAEAMASVRSQLAGTVVFVFQPAEENARGARAMLDDGALAGASLDAIFAFHTAPLPLGSIGTKSGVLLNANSVAPGATNDVALELRSRGVIRAVVGGEQLVVTTTVVPGFSEDFGHFQAIAPGVMFWLGVSNPERATVGAPHSADYVADDAAIHVGARTASALLLAELERK